MTVTRITFTYGTGDSNNRCHFFSTIIQARTVSNIEVKLCSVMTRNICFLSGVILATMQFHGKNLSKNLSNYPPWFHVIGYPSKDARERSLPSFSLRSSLEIELTNAYDFSEQHGISCIHGKGISNFLVTRFTMLLFLVDDKVVNQTSGGNQVSQAGIINDSFVSLCNRSAVVNLIVVALLCQ